MLYTITTEQIRNLIGRYIEKGGMVYTIAGSLNDNYILTGHGLKTAIISERCLNEWSSCNVVRFYSNCPKKYTKIMDMLESGQSDKAERLFFS